MNEVYYHIIALGIIIAAMYTIFIVNKEYKDMSWGLPLVGSGVIFIVLEFLYNAVVLWFF